MKNKFLEKGQTLLEVLIALAAASIIIAAIVAAVVSALSNEQFSISQNQATQFAQEGLDAMRNLSYTDWDTFVDYSNNTIYHCLGAGKTVPTQRSGSICPENMNTGTLIREIWIEPNACTSPTPPSVLNVQVKSVVMWSDGKCTGTGDAQYCHKVELISCYFKS